MYLVIAQIIASVKQVIEITLGLIIKKHKPVACIR